MKKVPRVAVIEKGGTAWDRIPAGQILCESPCMILMSYQFGSSVAPQNCDKVKAQFVIYMTSPTAPQVAKVGTVFANRLKLTQYFPEFIYAEGRREGMPVFRLDYGT